MRFIKTLFILLALTVAVPLIAALFVKSDYQVTTNVVINRPVAEVYDYVKYLKNQDNFSIWAKMDPAMKRSYRGVDGTVGFVSAWKSDNPEVGQGEQEIVAMETNKRIDYELRFLTPFEATEPAYMLFEPYEGNRTNLSWSFKGHLDYPTNLMFLFVDFETMIATDLLRGLSNLKLLLESEPTPQEQIQSP
ncbi:polyketide cyclase [Shewanella algae]|uniref:SRPBCC family protein n=1 Tax=Shewanella algae TaxID=38313 RepID=UPI0011AA5930|nr:SRPBCC family protein [Shewanella algae]TWO83765.1 polyketide cyclase [Shewanella algae]